VQVKNDDNNNNSMMETAANRVEQIYDFILGVGFVVLSILALANLFIVTINKFVEYYSRQIDRIVMDESECSDDDDDDSSESEYSEYSESEYSESSREERNDYDDDIELSPYIPPRRSQRLAENRARCNSPLLVCRLKFD
jgi:cytoskeletal protein RodZ